MGFHLIQSRRQNKTVETSLTMAYRAYMMGRPSSPQVFDLIPCTFLLVHSYDTPTGLVTFPGTCQDAPASWYLPLSFQQCSSPHVFPFSQVLRECPHPPQAIPGDAVLNGIPPLCFLFLLCSSDHLSFDTQNCVFILAFYLSFTHLHSPLYSQPCGVGLCVPLP